MKIDVSQKSGVGISIHDDELSELRFIREEKELRLSMLAWETAEVVPSEFKMKSPCYEIVFHQVRGFEMTSCDFWGQSQRALGLTLMRKGELSYLGCYNSGMRETVIRSLC